MSEVADVLPTNSGQAPAKGLVLALLALFLVHIPLFGTYFGMIAEVVATGAIPAIAPLVGLLADVALLVGIVLLPLKRYTQFTFFMSGVAFLLASKLLWNLHLERTLVLLTYGLGAAIACFGCWIVFGHSKPTYPILYTAKLARR